MSDIISKISVFYGRIWRRSGCYKTLFKSDNGTIKKDGRSSLIL